MNFTLAFTCRSQSLAKFRSSRSPARLPAYAGIPMCLTALSQTTVRVLLPLCISTAQPESRMLRLWAVTCLDAAIASWELKGILMVRQSVPLALMPALCSNVEPSYIFGPLCNFVALLSICVELMHLTNRGTAF